MNIELRNKKTSHYQSLMAEFEGFSTGYETLIEKNNKAALSFGIESLDKMFTVVEINKSGLLEGQKYEFYGAHRTGKTQLLMQLCVTVQLPKELGGLDKKGIFVDSEGTYNSERISQMCKTIRSKKNWDKSIVEILNDIIVTRAKNTDEQLTRLRQILKMVRKYPDQIGLVIVDSITAHFRAEYPDRASLSARQIELNKHLKILTDISNEGAIVVVSNQISTDPNSYSNIPENGIGGNVMAHWSNTRCYLRKSKGERRILRIVDSPIFGENEAVYEITANGVV